jgi:DNA-binding GntR family transcriptional regulator
LAVGDPDAAEEAMKAHIREASRRALTALKNQHDADDNEG